MHKFIGILLLLCYLPGAQAQKKEKGTRWMSLEQAEQSRRQTARPILIDLYTDWCGWCKVMDKRTYSNARVAGYLNEKFYPVKLNAESRSVFQYQGRSYGFNTEYKTNDIALYLTGGQLSYPTTVIIPGPGEPPQPIPGYLAPGEFELIVKYFGEGAYKTTPFPEYQRKFKKSW